MQEEFITKEQAKEQEVLNQDITNQNITNQDSLIHDTQPDGEKKGKSKIKWIAAGCVAVLLLIVAVICLVIRLKKSGSEAFEDFTEELFKNEIVLNTINLHYTLAYPEDFGITDYEVSLGSYSYEDFEESYDEMKQLKKEISQFDRNRLTKEQKITYDIIMDYLDTELAAKDFMLYGESLSPTTGYQAQLPVILAEYTFRTEKDIEDYLILVSQIDEHAEEIIEFEKEKADAGLFMADFAAEAVIEQCEDFIENPEENYMIEIFNDKIDAFEGLSDRQKEKYKEKNYEIITTDVVEGYETLIEGLEDLKGSGTNELGLCYYENGQEYYEYLVRSATGSDESIRKMEKRAEKYLSEFISDLQKEVLKDYSLYDELLDYEFPDMEPEEMMEDLMEKAKEDFPQPPEVNYTIKKVHPSMQENMSPAFYLTTPVDDLEHNVIYINDKYMGEDASMDLYPTMAHEGYPGHLYQNIYTGSCDLPLVRNLFSFSGYSEGWATYVEYEYSYKMSGAEEPLASLLAGNAGASLAISAYLDMKIHYDGWDREEVAEYLADWGIEDEETVDDLFELIVEEPANYLSYFIGYMEILELRETAEEALGDDFSAKEFHDFFLSFGPAPFYIIEDYMEEWITEQ